MVLFDPLVFDYVAARRRLIEGLVKEHFNDNPCIADTGPVPNCDQQHKEFSWENSSAAGACVLVHPNSDPCGPVRVWIAVEGFLEPGERDWNDGLSDAPAFAAMLRKARLRAGLTDWPELVSGAMERLEQVRATARAVLAQHLPAGPTDPKITETSEPMWLIELPFAGPDSQTIGEAQRVLTDQVGQPVYLQWAGTGQPG